ncbi:helicase-associated domain-containing protein [Nonomuraea sp. NPDC005501]|uniref:helicase-associated domain-containing protein n=1 Tax=Nonomuraea sp. NPDC005501 TaxID=3156884 RepID=UPI0033B18463
MPRDALTEWLATRSEDQLDLLVARAGLRRGRELAPQQLARHLTIEQVTAQLAAFCTLPELQALGGVAWLAAQTHGPLPGDRWQTPDPAERAVSRAEVVDLLAGRDPALREQARAVLERLADQALLLPPHGDLILAPAFVHRHLAEIMGLGRPAGQLIARHFNAQEVHRTAAALGLAKAPNRQAAEREVVACLTDPARLHGLLEAAPGSARTLLDRLAHEGPLIELRCFHPAGPHGHTFGDKYVFRPRGAGDDGADWLAARGLLLPSGVPGVAELPAEVGTAVRGQALATFTPEPPAPGELPAADGAEGAAQAALGALSWRLERLLAGCAGQPLSVRKNGGIAVRDTRRLAKSVGQPEDVTRLMLDLCVQAGLLGVQAEPVEQPVRRRGRAPDPVHVVLPTSAYDRWLSRPPGRRLARIVIAWATCRDIPLWWPDPEQTPVALAEPDDLDAVGLRYATLEALAAAPGRRAAGAVPYVQAAATWHRPLRMGDGVSTPHRIEATLREAELLGVTGQGALTGLGRAVLDLLRTGQAWKNPATALESVLTGMLPPPQAKARFQSDLTAVVAGTPTSALSSLLDVVGVRESEGHAVVWRIGPASVRRALDAGHEAGELLERLRAVAQDDLPQPLEYLVKDVGRTHGRMRVVRSGCCVRSDDEALLAELARAKALRKLGLRLIAPTVLISACPERETLDALRAAGYAPALEAETGATLIERPPSRRAAPRPARRT